MKKEINNILLQMQNNSIDVGEAANQLLNLFNVSGAKRKVCPQCKRGFDHTEVPSGIFCCYACEYGY